MLLSVIIPTFNEADNIANCITSIKQLDPLEIIVVDAGSSDQTILIAKDCGARVIKSLKGRGIQLHAGAQVAKGDMLLFVHADAVLEKNLSNSHIEDVLKEDYCGGFFRLRFDDPRGSARLVEVFANLRAKIMQLPYGDQAVFVSRGFYDIIGGFKPYPFLEDIDFALRLRKIGRLKPLGTTVTVSSRRFRGDKYLSPIIISLKNVLIATLFIIGVSPNRLINYYGGSK